jgi:hypothetical protein
VIDRFIVPSKDIIRNPDKSPKYNIRPIRFDYMGKQVTALSASEELPIDTEFKCVLRIREGSPLDDVDTLHKIFSHGKNLGLGAWRSSGNYGAYIFKLKALEHFKETFSDGWM